MKKIVKKFFLILILLTIISAIFTNANYAESRQTIYQLPERSETAERQGESGLDQIIEDADSMVEDDDVKYDRNKLKEFTRTLYNIIFALGIVASIAMGGILGSKIMLGGLEAKAQAKSLLIPYTVGCVVIFGGFGIWKLIIEIFQQL